MTKATKQSFIKKNNNKTTKNKTALSRIRRHNRGMHHPDRFTLPTTRGQPTCTACELYPLCLQATGTTAHQFITQVKPEAGHLQTGETRTGALLQPLLSGMQANSRFLSASEQWAISYQAGAAWTKASGHTPTSNHQNAGSPAETTTHGQIPRGQSSLLFLQFLERRAHLKGARDICPQYPVVTTGKPRL